MTANEKQDLINEIIGKLNEPKRLLVEICRDGVTLPEYSNFGDAGMDVRAATDVDIYPGETVVVPTGLKMAIPNGYEVEVRPRSGLSLKTPLRIPNTPGTVDSGYKDEIGIIISNTSLHGSEDSEYFINETGNKSGIYKIKKGDRIAQLVLCKYEVMNLIEASHEEILLSGISRGGGFGHTGVN